MLYCHHLVQITGSNASAALATRVRTTSWPKFIALTARRAPFLAAIGDHVHGRGWRRKDSFFAVMTSLKAPMNALAQRPPSKTLAEPFILSIRTFL